MTPSLSIARNTVREASRNKIFYSIFFFGLVIILTSFLVSEMSIAQFDRILRDVATGAIDFFGALLAIFLGIGLVSREIDRKTLYTVVTKPIRRSDFILGKFLGLTGVLAFSLGVMFVAFLGVLFSWSMEPPVLQPLLWYFALTLTELAVVVAFAILMSTFTSSAISAFVTVGLYVVGHLTPELRFFGQRSESVAVQWLTNALYYVLPNFERFNVSREVSHQTLVDSTTALFSVGNGLLFIAAFLVAAVVVFERRDFK